MAFSLIWRTFSLKVPTLRLNIVKLTLGSTKQGTITYFHLRVFAKRWALTPSICALASLMHAPRKLIAKPVLTPGPGVASNLFS